MGNRQKTSSQKVAVHTPKADVSVKLESEKQRES